MSVLVSEMHILKREQHWGQGGPCTIPNYWNNKTETNEIKQKDRTLTKALRQLCQWKLNWDGW